MGAVGSVVPAAPGPGAGLLGVPGRPRGSVRRGQAEQASEVGVAQADLEQPAGGPRRRLVRRAGGGVGLVQRRGLEPLLLVGGLLRPVRLDLRLDRARAGLRLPGPLLLFLPRRAVASASARSAWPWKPAGGAKSLRIASAR